MRFILSFLFVEIDVLEMLLLRSDCIGGFDPSNREYHIGSEKV